MFGKKKTHEYCSAGIVYASYEDYIKGGEVKQQVESLTKENADFKKQVASYKKELELLYLQAIGNANTTSEVNAVVRRYQKQFPLTISTTNPGIILPRLIGFCAPILIERNKSTVEKAANTKIKRLNRELVMAMSQTIDAQKDKAFYAENMMAILKSVANIEVDGTKILNARKAGLNALSVFESMLAAYNIKQSDVM